MNPLKISQALRSLENALVEGEQKKYSVAESTPDKMFSYQGEYGQTGTFSIAYVRDLEKNRELCRSLIEDLKIKAENWENLAGEAGKQSKEYAAGNAKLTAAHDKLTVEYNHVVEKANREIETLRKERDEAREELKKSHDLLSLSSIKRDIAEKEIESLYEQLSAANDGKEIHRIKDLEDEIKELKAREELRLLPISTLIEFPRWLHKKDFRPGHIEGWLSSKPGDTKVYKIIDLFGEYIKSL